jgi:hypothetical protein
MAAPNAGKQSSAARRPAAVSESKRERPSAGFGSRHRQAADKPGRRLTSPAGGWPGNGERLAEYGRSAGRPELARHRLKGSCNLLTHRGYRGV